MSSVLYICFAPADREVQRILLELLNQMDGFDQTVNVKVMTLSTCVFVCVHMYVHVCVFFLAICSWPYVAGCM